MVIYTCFFLKLQPHISLFVINTDRQVFVSHDILIQIIVCTFFMNFDSESLWVTYWSCLNGGYNCLVSGYNELIQASINSITIKCRQMWAWSIEWTWMKNIVWWLFRYHHTVIFAVTFGMFPACRFWIIWCVMPAYDIVLIGWYSQVCLGCLEFCRLYLSSLTHLLAIYCIQTLI